jgi:hypothetical protein
MRIKMTIDECLEFADEWARGCTFHEGSQGWRVVCMLLADEVRRLRGERFVLAQLLDAAAQVMHTLDGEDMTEECNLRALQERLERASLEARGFATVQKVGAGDTPMARLFGCCADDADKTANVKCGTYLTECFPS